MRLTKAVLFSAVFLVFHPIVSSAQGTPGIADLEKQKAKAVAEENFVLAGELKKQIEELKEKEAREKMKALADQQRRANKAKQLAELEKQKKEAVAAQDFTRAAELKKQIQKLTEIEDLEKEKREAVAAADYAKASVLSKKIAALKAVEEQEMAMLAVKAEREKEIAVLEAQKKEAAAKQDYSTAAALQKKIQTLKEPPAVPKASPSAASSGLASGGSGAPQNRSAAAASPSTQSFSANPPGSIVYTKTERSKIRSSEDNSTAGINYKRSSLYTMMIHDAGRNYSDVIAQSFVDAPLPGKFNDHDLNEKVIPASSGGNQTANIDHYLNTNAIAKAMVAKWFNRNENGTFNMDLIAERGNYNATAQDLKIAALSARGNALLADAGEELIANTFIVVNDFRYTNKEEVANAAKTGMSLLSGISSLAGGPDLSVAETVTNTGLTVAGKGYVIKTVSYLYRLVWNEEVAARFYQEYWMDESSFDPAKKAAFENSNIFTLRYIGEESALADLQSNVFTSKTEEELIARATAKAVDAGIAKLQRKFEEFRTKTPLVTVDPPTAKIGLKEGLEPGDRFEVLEAVQDPTGKTQYVRKGVITVSRDIWDNQFDIGEGNPNAGGREYTTFNGNGPYYPGMLIKQIR